MFGQIPPTEFDLRFSILGIPVRVHPVFWLTSAFLAWGGSDADLRRIFVRVLCIFLAILVHELGHAVVTRRFGWNSEVVLYFFGGYATSMRHTTWKDIAVSAAGPGAGFVLYFAFLYLLQQVLTGNLTVNELVLDAIGFSLFINFVWNVANLIPVLPLDGGQISRELCCWLSPRRGMGISLMISMIISGTVALWSFRAKANGESVLGLDPLFLGIMFAYLCYQSYQSYETSRRGPW